MLLDAVMTKSAIVTKSAVMTKSAVVMKLSTKLSKLMIIVPMKQPLILDTVVLLKIAVM